MTSVRRDYLTFSAHQKPTVGDQKFSAVGIDHLGWLICDGRLLNVKDWLLLFDVIGYQFGGSGAQFRLPDPAGRVPGIAGSGTGLTTRAIGDSVGEETHVLTIAEMPSHNHGTNASDSVVGNNLTGLAGSHTHTITDPGHFHSGTANQASTATNGLSNNTNNGGNTGTSTTGITVDAVGDHQHSIATQGGDDPHNNMQPTLFMGNMFIYSGKVNYGNYPYTAGYYTYPSQNTLYSNIE